MRNKNVHTSHEQEEGKVWRVTEDVSERETTGCLYRETDSRPDQLDEA